MNIDVRLETVTDNRGKVIAIEPIVTLSVAAGLGIKYDHLDDAKAFIEETIRVQLNRLI